MTSRFLELIAKTKAYLFYIENHYANVQQAWTTIKDKCSDMSFVKNNGTRHALDAVIREHDISKLDLEEFIPYRKQFYPASFEDANDNEIDARNAWAHHKMVNTHHWENWTGRSEHWGQELACVHMVADWVAMSYAKGGTAKEYYEGHKDKIQLPDWAVELIYEIFRRLEDE